MTNELQERDLPAVLNLDRPMSVNDVLTQSMIVHEILERCMMEDVHYGTLPGTKKKTLYLPGAEKICVTFRLAPKFDVEDLSDPHGNFYRYRAKCSLYTIRDSMFVGSAMGEASTAEEKYQWEAALSQKHFDSTDPDKRRIKFKKTKEGDVEEILQVQQNCADLANTVLKMACKRAFTSAAKGATAASDLLDVDMEEEAVAKLHGEERKEATKDAPKMKAKPKPAQKFPYGKHKGVAIDHADVTVDDLTWWINRLEGDLREGKNKQYERSNKEFLAALQQEVARRQQEPVKAPIKEPVKEPEKKEQAKTDRQPMDDDAWVDACLLWFEQDQEVYSQAADEFKVKDPSRLASGRRNAFQDRIKELSQKNK
jgi:hypothetical protein